MVPGAGLEPARPRGQRILSPLCLPISPSGQKPVFGSCSYLTFPIYMVIRIFWLLFL